jgi:hypothetical protein
MDKIKIGSGILYHILIKVMVILIHKKPQQYQSNKSDKLKMNQIKIIFKSKTNMTLQFLSVQTIINKNNTYS